MTYLSDQPSALAGAGMGGGMRLVMHGGPGRVVVFTRQTFLYAEHPPAAGAAGTEGKTGQPSLKLSQRLPSRTGARQPLTADTTTEHRAGQPPSKHPESTTAGNSTTIGARQRLRLSRWDMHTQGSRPSELHPWTHEPAHCQGTSAPQNLPATDQSVREDCTR
jgi:hypothetical protein